VKAVLADAAEQRADLIVNLGDICSGGLQPLETAELLQGLALPTITGNHERQVLTMAPDAMGLSDRHAAQNLKAADRAWFRSLPATLRPVEGVLMVHGTQRSDLEYFLETVTEDGLRAATMEEIEERAQEADAWLILCGHTHIPRQVRLADGRLIVNPGSLGLPAYDDDRPSPHLVETGSPHARYAIVTGERDIWSAELRCVEYDWDEAARLALANGRSDWARALTTGRVVKQD
jgi:diadenosine tetraphosphatase ApaH/serine/threonine PP2A family protein phosphatase